MDYIGNLAQLIIDRPLEVALSCSLIIGITLWLYIRISQ